MSSSIYDTLAFISSFCSHCRQKKRKYGIFLFQTSKQPWIRSLNSCVFLETLNIWDFFCRLLPHVIKYAVLWWSKFLWDDVWSSAHSILLPDFVFYEHFHAIWCYSFECIILASFPLALISTILVILKQSSWKSRCIYLRC